ncbi:MAG TPA: hypothetical protein VHQ86_03845 [Candidatus Saccharimonadia bacterium]|jgi:photosystem II stability/assembly factor-like uncharacterized protein|nr:hypothetical protein [Candidatus Saccharimonadia bacterium]
MNELQTPPPPEPPKSSTRLSRFNEKYSEPSQALLLVLKALGVGGIIAVAVVLVSSLNFQPRSPKPSASNSLEDTGYTGVAADVLTNQTFDCAPRNEHEWYRTDRTFVIDPKDADTMYVNVEYKGPFKSTDGGKTWGQIAKGLKVYARSDDKTKGCYGEYPVIRIDPADNKHLILGMSGGGGGFLDATTPNSQTGGVYQSVNGGASWKLMINNKMNIYVNDAVFDPVTRGTVYYGTASNPASYQEADQNKLFVTKGLIYQTLDNGKNWTELPTGIGERTGAVRVFVNPKDPKEIMAPTYSAVRQSADGTGTGISTGKDTSAVPQLGILHSTNGGQSWSQVQLPGNLPIMAGFTSPTMFGHQFYVPMSQSGTPVAYVTLDGGKTFKQTKYLDVVAYDPFDPSGNHAVAYSTVGGTPTRPGLNLWETRDGGLTWAELGTLPAEIKDLNDAKVRPSLITWHPTDLNTIYMSGAGGHIWKSSDLGKTWTTLLDYTKLPK